MQSMKKSTLEDSSSGSEGELRAISTNGQANRVQPITKEMAPKTKAFVDDINRMMREPLSKGRYIAPAILSLPAAVAGGLPFWKAGIELAHSNSSTSSDSASDSWNNPVLGYTYAVSSAGINAVLYYMFAFGLVRLIMELVVTSSSFKQLMPRENYRILIAFLAFVIIAVATWSAAPYLALAQLTAASLGVTIDTVASNIVLHGEAFRIALTTPNVLFHQHVWQPLRRLFMQCCSSTEAIEAYERKIKYNYVQSELSAAIRKNLKAAISGNYAKKELKEIILNYHPSNSRDSIPLSVARWSTGMGFCGTTFVSLSGYLLSAYLALKKDLKSTIGGMAGTIGANVAFLYLVMKSVYRVATTQIFDLFVQIQKDGFRDTMKSANWFYMHKALCLILLLPLLAAAGLSFPSSVYLIEKSFPQIPGLSKLVDPAKGISYPISGVFNLVGAKDFLILMSVISQILKDAVGYRMGEGELLIDESQVPGKKSYQQLRSDLYYDEKSAEINRLNDRIVDDELLQVFSDFLKSELPDQANEIISRFTTLDNIEQLDAFIDEDKIAPAFQDESPYAAGRTALVSNVKSAFFYTKAKFEECGARLTPATTFGIS